MTTPAAAALLFERLTGSGRHDAETLKTSVMAEVERLFNTRAPVDGPALMKRRRSTVDYGIPDLSLFPPNDPDAEADLTRHLTAALIAYEPRLRDPKVTLARVPGAGGGLVAQIAGKVYLAQLPEALSFTVALRPHGG